MVMVPRPPMVARRRVSEPRWAGEQHIPSRHLVNDGRMRRFIRAFGLFEIGGAPIYPGPARVDPFPQPFSLTS